MIFGSCPYCDEPFSEAVPERTPAFAKIKCDSCGKEFWECYSRLDPCCYTLEEFEAKFIVDDVKHTITERYPAPPLTDDEKAAVAVITETFIEEITRQLLYGSGSANPKLSSVTLFVVDN